MKTVGLEDMSIPAKRNSMLIYSLVLSLICGASVVSDESLCYHIRGVRACAKRFARRVILT
jgi:hypothetical protein